MVRKKHLVWFEEVDKDDIGLVGGKGANLGEMIQARFPIPYGFIVTANAYFYFLERENLERNIKKVLAAVNYDNPTELQETSKHIKNLIMEAEMPRDLAREIVEHYEMLSSKEAKYLKEGKTKASLYKQPLVAVRSSATAEDLPTASFAGQQESYLNVRGEHVLLLKVKQCWASLFTERAIYYRHQQGFDQKKVGLAAVVQRMVQSDQSGVAFSIDPVTNDKTKIIIEAIFGLGEYIVLGEVNPDHYEIAKNSLVFLQKKVSHQGKKLVKRGSENVNVKLSKSEGSRQKISDEQIIQIALLVKDIEKHYFFPQDIEWAIESDKVFIVQSRPITTIKEISAQNKKHGQEASLPTPILTGSPASPGIGAGPVKVIFSPKEIIKIKQGDVLVAPQTNPDYVPAMKKAVAIVTEKGGRTSHAAIVSRELGIPAVVGADGATKILHNDEIVTVNGIQGEIYKGKLSREESKQDKEHKHNGINHRHKLRTLTKVYVNLAEPEEAAKVAKMDVDGVGLLRAEFMIAEIGIHPKEFIKKGREALFIRKLSHDLLEFVKPFHPRPIIYRSTDFKTNEYRHLVGGEKYEPKEENPMLGYRGASRYIADPEIFNLELDTIKAVWEKGYHNLHLMIPFVRRPWELIKIKSLITQRGLFDLPGFKLYMMVEVPASALELEEFIKIGIDGVSIGTNDLTMMLLGVDRDNAEVASLYDERSTTVMSVLEYIVETCAKHGITCSICGQAASDYPELVETLVRKGITSVSINPDAVERTRELIHQIESKHVVKQTKQAKQATNFTPLNIYGEN